MNRRGPGDKFAAAHAAQVVHGHAKRNAWSRTYKSWRYMRDRVSRDPAYVYITICTRWDCFANFLSDMGEQPNGKTLDRIDNYGGYEPANCRWATPIQQANNRSTNVRLVLNGVERTVAEWARHLNMEMRTLHNRIHACGWSVERALTTPLRGWNKYGRKV